MEILLTTSPSYPYPFIPYSTCMISDYLPFFLRSWHLVPVKGIGIQGMPIKYCMMSLMNAVREDSSLSNPGSSEVVYSFAVSRSIFFKQMRRSSAT